MPIPEITDEEILLKGVCNSHSMLYFSARSYIFLVSYCGICGTDAHIHHGEFIAKFPVSQYRPPYCFDSYCTVSQLIPGHEVTGSIAEVGKNVKDFKKGDRCVADNAITVRTIT